MAALLRCLFLACCLLALAFADDSSNDTDTTNATTSTRVPYTKPTEIPSTIPTECGDEEFLFIPLSGECNMYQVCNYGHPVYNMTCASGTYFRYDTQECDWPAYADCSDDDDDEDDE